MKLIACIVPQGSQDISVNYYDYEKEPILQTKQVIEIAYNTDLSQLSNSEMVVLLKSIQSLEQQVEKEIQERLSYELIHPTTYEDYKL